MKSMKKFIGVFVMALVLFVPSVFATTEMTDYEKDLIKKVAPDGENATINSVAPEIFENEWGEYDNSYSLLTSMVNKLIDDDNYYVYAWCDIEDFSSCKVEISSKDIEWGPLEDGNYGIVDGWDEIYDINVTWNEPTDTNMISSIKDLASKVKVNEQYASEYYVVTDLSLINYFLTGDNSELWNPGAASRAIKFSNINDITNNANVTYDLQVGLGEQGEELMYESAGGALVIYYNGYAYADTSAGVFLRRVIYIPEDTEDTIAAYIAAAQKRINDYLGNESVIVSKGDALSTLADNIDEDSPMYGVGYEDLLDAYVSIDDTDGNYYNIKIGNRTYKFYIIKSDEIPDTPTYNAVNLDSNVIVTSDDASVPLDTTVTVKEVSDSKVNKALGTDELVSYDITLYSDAKEASITKLDNGKFEVSIPVPASLKDKDINVYYVNTDGEVETHNAKIENGVATFETNHFSTYTLAANVNLSGVEAPNTLDNITVSFAVGILAIIGVIGASLYLSKQMN